MEGFIKFLRAYLEEGGSDEHPLQVKVTNYVAGTSNIDDNGITFVSDRRSWLG